MFSARYSSGILRIGALFPFAFESGVPLLEGIGDVFQKDDPKDDMLVFGGIHAAAQGVGHLPKFGLIAGRRAAIGLRACHRLQYPHFSLRP